jgi:hypothetical protein
MDGALVDVGSHHPKKRNDNHYVGLCVEYRIEVLFLFSFVGANKDMVFLIL